MIKLPQNSKKIPERNCVGCGNSFPKIELLRVVKAPNGDIDLDPTDKRPGRGAYICRNTECLKKARKAKRFERSLAASIPDSVYDKLQSVISEDAGK